MYLIIIGENESMQFLSNSSNISVTDYKDKNILMLTMMHPGLTNLGLYVKESGFIFCFFKHTHHLMDLSTHKT